MPGFPSVRSAAGSPAGLPVVPPTVLPTVPPAGLGRRSVTGAALASALVVAGCAATPGAGTTLDLTPDARLVLDALADERALLLVLRTAARRHRGLRTALADARRTHRRHVEVLGGAVATSNGTAAAPWAADVLPRRGSPTQVRAAVARAEGTLADRHLAGSLEAASGTLARLLASLSAAAAQQSRVLEVDA